MAYVCTDRGVNPAGRGGSATHIREMVRALVARGNEVTVLAADGAGAEAVLPCRVIDLQADVVASRMRDHLRHATRDAHDTSMVAGEVLALLLNEALASALCTLNPPPDIIYERQSLFGVAALGHALRRGIPHLLEVNAPLVAQQKAYRELGLIPAANAVEDFVLAGSTRVLVTSHELTAYARSHGASRRNVRVVPCGVPAALLSAMRTPSSEARDPAQFVVGFVGSLKPWHGIDVLLRAFRKLRPGYTGYRLRIVGDGPEREGIERYLHLHGLEDFCEITGGVDPQDIAAQLARMDVAVAPYPAMPSFYFSPLKLWEYAGYGVPIVASAVGDLPKRFPHRSAAMLHPPGNASKLAAHITELREDPVLAARLVRNARKIAQRNSWDRLAARVEGIAAKALAP